MDVALAEPDQVDAFEANAPLDRSRRDIEDAEDRSSMNRLAGTRLAEDGEHLSAFEGVTDAVDGLDGALVGLKLDAKIVDLE
jgi:hypothetical protein